MVKKNTINYITKITNILIWNFGLKVVKKSIIFQKLFPNQYILKFLRDTKMLNMLPFMT